MIILFAFFIMSIAINIVTIHYYYKARGEIVTYENIVKKTKKYINVLEKENKDLDYNNYEINRQLTILKRKYTRLENKTIKEKKLQKELKKEEDEVLNNVIKDQKEEIEYLEGKLESLVKVMEWLKKNK